MVLGEALRSYAPVHRAALRTLLRESSWIDLPHADRGTPRTGLGGSIIIPAHNESAVLGRTLDAVTPLCQAGVEVVVAANGCSDGTVEIARAAPGTRVLDLPAPGKTAALNAADAVAGSWPRLYLDADVTVTPRAVMDVFTQLQSGALAARPPYVWDLRGAGPLVRSYYRARSRMPSMSRALWGAGVYALSKEGHRRVAPFPDVIADDLLVDSTFAQDEKVVVPTDPAVVRTPRTTTALLTVLRRQARGPAQLGVSTSASTVRELASTVTGPLSLLDAVVYASLAIAARSGRDPAGTVWERDATSRGPS
ncbi:glycosyltransferase [Ornithinimicrobium kibberense]|uniref:glycosyltransferase n=1 Tax=Ornithinimicrobium kibberense TaxID=282060 RepID=UPI00360EE74F